MILSAITERLKHRSKHNFKGHFEAQPLFIIQDFRADRNWLWAASAGGG